MYTIKFGLELECGIPIEKVNFSRGAYHSGIPLKNNSNWKAESDGSLSSLGERVTMVELVSNVFDLSGFNEIFKEINKYDIHINKTCGAHIHFSLWDNDIQKDIRKYFSLSVIKEIRKEINKGAKGILKDKYPEFASQYSRHYARKCNSYNAFNDRHREFNFTKEQYKTIEYRAFNLLGCESNEQIKAMYVMALHTIQRIVLKEIEQPKSFTEKVNKVYNFCEDTTNIIVNNSYIPKELKKKINIVTDNNKYTLSNPKISRDIDYYRIDKTINNNLNYEY